MFRKTVGLLLIALLITEPDRAVKAITSNGLALKIGNDSLPKKRYNSAIKVIHGIITKLECAAVCGRETNCLSFSVDVNRCTLYDRKHTKEELKTSKGYSYYHYITARSKSKTEMSMSTDKKSYPEAAAKCVTRHGRLLSIHDEKTHNKLKEKFIRNGWGGYAWLGLRARLNVSEDGSKRTWNLRWEDGTDFNCSTHFNRFGSGGPQLKDGNCIAVSLWNLEQWFAKPCESRNHYICEIES